MFAVYANTDSIKHRLFSNGLETDHNAHKFLSAIAAIYPDKKMYVQRDGHCVRIYANLEYTAPTFVKRIAELKKHLLYLNAPFGLLTEELKHGNGIDFCLWISNPRTDGRKHLLEVPSLDGYSSSPRVIENPRLPEVLVIHFNELKVTPIVEYVEFTSYHTLAFLNRHSVSFVVNDSRFVGSSLYKKLENYSTNTKFVDSFTAHRSADKLVSCSMYSQF